ncbi:MAG: hypothetical protein ACK4NP_05095 [Parvularculaceae bacterium]
MEIFGVGIWAAIGFALAAYAVVGNDALQTLGTFINSNQKLPWWALFLFAATVLVISFAFGYIQYGGDPSWGRLADVKKFPIVEIEWYHVTPALALLVLTRVGIPVSTTFMVLTTFATAGGLGQMLEKSLFAYGASFLLGLILYAVLAPTIERHFLRTPEKAQKPLWILLQWTTTAYLWAVWLIQDFANIFVYLPRQLDIFQVVAGVAVILVLLLYTFANRGGPVQKILRSKSNVVDIRSATIVDFTYASILGYAAYVSNTPMSTTWAFLGFIAGREVSIATIDKIRPFKETLRNIGGDALKATIGLVISVGLAVGMPRLAEYLHQNGIG